MNSSDVLEMYKKGYSIDYIINQYYKCKIKDDKSNYRIGNKFVIIDKSVKKENVRKEIEELILKNSPISNKAN